MNPKPNYLVAASLAKAFCCHAEAQGRVIAGRDCWALPNQSSVRNVFFVLVMAFVMTCVPGCASTSNKHAAAILVVNGVVYDQEWKRVEWVRVYEDGHYRYTMLYWRGKRHTTEYSGWLPRALVNQLREVAGPAEAGHDSSIPTYSYRLEDSHHCNPEAVKDLVALVHEKALPNGL